MGICATSDDSANSTQLSVLSKMNEQLATENAALIAELATLQRRQTRQAIQTGRQGEAPAFIAGVPATQLESLLSMPGTAAAAAAPAVQPPSASESVSPASPIRRLSSMYPEGNEEEEQQDCTAGSATEDPASKAGRAWADAHSNLHQRARHLETQIELTRLRAECETLRAEAAEEAAQAVTQQGVIHTLQRQLSAADKQHQKEVKELRKAAKQIERRSEQLAEQLPKPADDLSVQVYPLHTVKNDVHGCDQHSKWQNISKLLMIVQSALLRQAATHVPTKWRAGIQGSKHAAADYYTIAGLSPNPGPCSHYMHVLT